MEDFESCCHLEHHTVRAAAEHLYHQSISGSSSSYCCRPPNDVLNSGISEVVPPSDVVTGMRPGGRMSVVRRFFCLFVTFDLLFTVLMWLICNMLISGDVFKMMSEQIVHYSIHTSLFDIVMAAAARFVVLLLFYALLYINHWCIIALSTAGTCSFLIAKVFLYNWVSANSPVLQVLLIITSFVISWGEAWFLDFRVIPQEAIAQDIMQGRTGVQNERSPLLNSFIQQTHTYQDDQPESVRNFYSPVDSPVVGDSWERKSLDSWSSTLKHRGSTSSITIRQTMSSPVDDGKVSEGQDHKLQNGRGLSIEEPLQLPIDTAQDDNNPNQRQPVLEVQEVSFVKRKPQLPITLLSGDGGNVADFRARVLHDDKGSSLMSQKQSSMEFAEDINIVSDLHQRTSRDATDASLVGQKRSSVGLEVDSRIGPHAQASQDTKGSSILKVKEYSVGSEEDATIVAETHTSSDVKSSSLMRQKKVSLGTVEDTNSGERSSLDTMSLKRQPLRFASAAEGELTVPRKHTMLDVRGSPLRSRSTLLGSTILERESEDETADSRKSSTTSAKPPSTRAELLALAHEAVVTAWKTISIGGWRKEVEAANGDKVESHERLGGKKGRMYRLEGEVQMNPDGIRKLLFNQIESMPLWNPTLTLARQLETIDEQTDISYQVMAEGGGGLFAPRDLVTLRRWEREGSAIIIVSVSVTHPAAPPKKKPIRAHQGPSCFVLEPGRFPGSTRLRWLVDTELKGWIPQALLDQAYGSALSRWLHHLRSHTEAMVSTSQHLEL